MALWKCCYSLCVSVLFWEFIFPHVCFRLKMSRTLCAPEPVKCRAEVMTMSWKGFPLAFDLQHGYTAHQCAVHMLPHSDLISLIYEPPRMYCMFILLGHYVLCCLVCVKHLYVVHLKVPLCLQKFECFVKVSLTGSTHLHVKRKLNEKSFLLI